VRVAARPEISTLSSAAMRHSPILPPRAGSRSPPQSPRPFPPGAAWCWAGRRNFPGKRQPGSSVSAHRTISSAAFRLWPLPGTDPLRTGPMGGEAIAPAKRRGLAKISSYSVTSPR
jgi:hypothetical protein